MSDSQSERTRLADEARHEIERIEGVIRGDIADLEKDDTPLLDEAEEAERWGRWGQILRGHDPGTYRMLSRLALAVAALAIAPVEN